MAAGVLVVMLFGRFPNFFRALSGKKQGGRWIRDRSLGGKMVSHTSCCYVTILPAICNHILQHLYHIPKAVIRQAGYMHA